jgi:hypothetical protein
MTDAPRRPSRYPLTADLAGVLAAAGDERTLIRSTAGTPAGSTGAFAMRVVRRLVRRTFARRVHHTRSEAFGETT